MTEITLCINSGCQKRGSCYRYQAQLSDQKRVEKYAPENGICSHYIYEPGTDDEPAKTEW